MKKYLFSLTAALLSLSVYAQADDPVIMTINGKEVKKSEFEYIYRKNNTEASVDKKSLEEYVELFKNFKLKVAEAEAQGLDTTSSFIAELNEYRNQLAKPYLTLEPDMAPVEKIYNRMGEVLEISHIMVAYPAVAQGERSVQILPADTLELYGKVMAIHSRLKKGADFKMLVKEYSDDTRTKQLENPGYLGWITGLKLLPVLEDAAYSTPAGGFSSPVRSNFGYHIIKVWNRKPNPGLLRAAHILISTAQETGLEDKREEIMKLHKEKADSIYQAIQRGGDFAQLARDYSQDPGSAGQGGELNWFGYGDMVSEFQEEAYALAEVGQVSKPFSTPYGFHIIKLLDKRPIPSLDERRGEIESRLSNGGFFVELHQTSIEKMKKDLAFTPRQDAYNALYSTANTVYPLGEAFPVLFGTKGPVLFSIGNEEYHIVDFLEFLKNSRRYYSNFSIDLLKERLGQFECDMLLKAENATLEARHTEFRQLMQEYHDGILMFEISNKEVWNKASEDVEGLERFFQEHKANYTWDEPRFKGCVVQTMDSKARKKMQKETSKMNPDDAASFLLENYKVGDVSQVKVDKGLFKKGDNAFVDEVAFKTGKAELTGDFKDFFLCGDTFENPQTYTDSKGQVITDYQDYLEKEWIRSLNEKYKVTIYPDVIFTIK